MISVVLPVLNAQPEYFKQTLESLRNQTFGDFEVLIIEDPGLSSIENTVESMADRRFRLVKNNSIKGFAEQLNSGIRLAKNEFIARLDADDIAHADRFAKQLAVLQRDKNLSLTGSFIRLIDDRGRLIGRRIYPEKAAEIKQKACLYSPLAHPAVMFRKADVIRNGGYSAEFGLTADYDLWARLLNSGCKLENLPEFLTDYRIHTNASKFASLKSTLAATIAIKRRYFQRSSSWNLLAQLRLTMETILLRLPPKLVYRAFLLSLRRIEL